MALDTQCISRIQGLLSGAVTAAAISLVLTGCGTLPSNGPDVSQVVRATRGPAPAFRIVDLDSAAVAAADAQQRPRGSFAPLAGIMAHGAVNELHVGDTLRLTLYEIGASLFAPSGSANGAQAAGEASPAAVNHVMPEVHVQPNGDVTVPYVGEVAAAGKTPQDLAFAIERGLQGQSQSPQVVVSVQDDLGNTVFIMGDVRSPGRKLLAYERERLLDMIAIAGGSTQDGVDTVVRVTRQGVSAELPLSDIASGSADDIVLEPQDRISLLYRPKSFTAFGAAGKVAEVPFHVVRLNLAEALGRVGGPLDQQADPTGVFIFRLQNPNGQLPVVWRVNLKDPRSYFVTQTFIMQDKDVIFIANSRSSSIAKFLAIINNVISPVVTAKYLGS